VDVILKNVTSGVSGFAFGVTVQNPSIARIEAVSIPDFGFQLSTGAPGSSVDVLAADVNEAMQGAFSSVVLATLDVELLGVGTTQLQLTLNQLDSDANDDNNMVPITGISPGTLTIN
jgi:hypothetical protein